MKIKDKIKKFVIICLSILGVIIMGNIAEGARPSEKTPPGGIEPIKDFKIELIGNSAIVTWEKSKDKRVIGYDVGYFNDEYEDVSQNKVTYENRCVFVDLPLNIELWFFVYVNGYDTGYISSYAYPRYALYDYDNKPFSPDLDKYKVIAKEKTKPEEYTKLSKEAKKYDIPLVKVKDIQANPEKYFKKIIRLEGEIFSIEGVLNEGDNAIKLENLSGYFIHKYNTDESTGVLLRDKLEGKFYVVGVIKEPDYNYEKWLHVDEIGKGYKGKREYGELVKIKVNLKNLPKELKDYYKDKEYRYFTFEVISAWKIEKDNKENGR